MRSRHKVGLLFSATTYLLTCASESGLNARNYGVI